MAEQLMDKIIALAKRRGFIYPGSEIYGGLANTYDYGPMGTELMRNIRNVWWETFVQKRPDMVGIEASLISHQEIWKASGHTTGFADAMVDCHNCKLRKRADHLIEEYLENLSEEQIQQKVEKFDANNNEVNRERIKNAVIGKKVEGLSLIELQTIITTLQIPCPNCVENTGDKWTDVRKFNQLFPVNLGIVVGDQSLAYLRGETAQGMFYNFRNVLDSTRVKLPFGIAQNGKSFRNEITPGNSVFRTLVFEQAEIEYFFDPQSSDWEKLFENWKEAMWQFITQDIKITKENLRWRTHTDEERSFYSKRTEDLEYQFPFGFKELWGIAYRTDYDLSQHEKYAKKELRVVDPQTGKKILPHVIEPAVGIDRIFLMILCDAYSEEENRTVLKIAPRLAPYKVAVFPLLANKEQLVNEAQAIYDSLKHSVTTAFDARGNIGKRYLSQDEVGTPFCVTVDFQTLEDGTVTVRERDSMKQERVPKEKLLRYTQKSIANW